MIMTEGSLDIVFDESYCAVKFDDSLFYREKFEKCLVLVENMSTQRKKYYHVRRQTATP